MGLDWIGLVYSRSLAGCLVRVAVLTQSNPSEERPSVQVVAVLGHCVG